MARNTPLAARPVNYVELIGNGRLYEVPPYQRDYSWGHEQWEDLWNDILDLRGQEDDRHYMGRRRLFKVVRDRHVSASDVYHLLEVLESRAELFAAVADPSHGYWVDTPEARRHVAELRVFRVTQMMPLLFVAWEEWSRRDFARTLKTVCVLAFRHTVVGRRNANELETVYHRASKAVKVGHVTGPGELFEVLRPIYPSDEQTRTDFEFLSINARGPRKRLAKHLLARLESDASGKPCDPDTDAGGIEHVLPEKPGREWEEAFPPGRQDAMVHRVGNLTLLEANRNREVGNAAYGAKVSAFRESRYALTKAIPEIAPEEWTPALLEHRQRLLAKRAIHLWRADFA